MKETIKEKQFKALFEKYYTKLYYSSLGRVRDYYANEESIDLTAGGTLECTGEYELKWIGQKRSQD